MIQSEFIITVQTKGPSRRSRIAYKIIIWLIWSFSAVLSALMAVYLTIGHVRNNSFAGPINIFTVGMFFIPIIICGALRFWVSRIRNTWLGLAPYILGVVFAQQAELYGIYLLPEFLIVFQILSAVLFLIYLPLFVKPAPSNHPD